MAVFWLAIIFCYGDSGVPFVALKILGALDASPALFMYGVVASVLTGDLI